MTRRAKVSQPSGYTVMLVDDNADYLQATRLLLERDGHDVLTATNGREALSLLPKHKVDLLLLDYFMPGMTGEQVVAEIRKHDPHVQVILQTGYASEQPPQELLRRLDIQGYYDKTEGPDQLLMWTAVGLKAARTIQTLNKNRDALRELLRAAPELQKAQPLADMLSAALRRGTHLAATVGPLGAGDAPNAEIEGFIALVDGRREIVVAAATGKFASVPPHSPRELEPHIVAAVQEALGQTEIVVMHDGTIVPLSAGAVVVGVLFLGGVAISEQALDLVRVFANQVAIAVQNARLFDMLNVDPQTGLHARAFFDDWLLRAINDSIRYRDPLGLVLCTFDAASPVGDREAALGSELAISLLGGALARSSRAGDVVARFGPDEFGIIVPRATALMLEGLASRWVQMVGSNPVRVGAGNTWFAGSAAFGMFEPQSVSEEQSIRLLPSAYFGEARDSLVRNVRAALAEARQARGGTRHATGIVWPAESGSY